MNRVLTPFFAGAAQCASIRSLLKKTHRTAGGTEAAFTHESLESGMYLCDEAQLPTRCQFRSENTAAESREFQRRSRKKHRALAAFFANTIQLKNVSVQCECAAQSPFAQGASGKAPGFDKAGLDETIEKTLRREYGRGCFCMICTNTSRFAAEILCNQRLENWGARRAAFRPYFLRSFIRGSRVRKPAFLMAGFRSMSALTRERAMP